MKKSKLLAIINKAINEVLNEETFAGKNTIDDLKKIQNIQNYLL